MHFFFYKWIFGPSVIYDWMTGYWSWILAEKSAATVRLSNVTAAARAIKAFEMPACDFVMRWLKLEKTFLAMKLARRFSVSPLCLFPQPSPSRRPECTRTVGTASCPEALRSVTWSSCPRWSLCLPSSSTEKSALHFVKMWLMWHIEIFGVVS